MTSIAKLAGRRDIEGRSCTMQDDNGAFCGRDTSRHIGQPVCFEHALDIYRDLTAMLDIFASDDTSMLALIFHNRDLLRRDRVRRRVQGFVDNREPVVYYLFLDGLIKIGHTIDLDRRIRTYPPQAHLLATEPGGREIEKDRHSQFAAYLAERREWFTPHAELWDHIRGLAHAA